MKKKHNAAIVILAARIPLLFRVISRLQSNWNNKYNYPIYIHTFGNLIDNNLKKKIKDTFKTEIFFFKLRPHYQPIFQKKKYFITEII